MSEDNNQVTSVNGNTGVDKLDQIFDAQEKFRRIMGKGQDCIVDLMDEQQKGQLIYDHCQAIASELQELINCIYWKSWTKEAKEGKRYMFRNKENLKEEIADILCFLGDICAAVDLGPDELAAINVRKTEVNIQRQLNKYAMDTKDGADSAAIWQQIKDGEFKSSSKQKEEKAVKDIQQIQSLNKKLQEQGLAPRYLSDKPDNVYIQRIADLNEGYRYSVTLESTNETKEIILSEAELYSNVSESPRNILMKRITEVFGLTKPFQISEQ